VLLLLGISCWLSSSTKVFFFDSLLLPSMMLHNGSADSEIVWLAASTVLASTMSLLKGENACSV
jgi:hypothetical protein